MPTARKPKPYRHPRSLDALFPAPKPKRCARGHTQTPEWRAIHGCSTCRKVDAQLAEHARLAAGAGAAERERERATVRQLPDPYVLHDYHGRVVGVYHSGGPRGPKGRKRIRKRP